jgi:hypothetical protein
MAVYTREVAKVRLAKAEREKDAEFLVDWHMVALPIIQQRSTEDPLYIFRQWMSRMLILWPTPILISGDSNRETREPSPEMTDFGAWFSGLLAYSPAAYTTIDRYLRQVMPDLKDIKNPLIGTDARGLEVQFAANQETITLPFGDLSDGDKCFMISALVLAANSAHGPVFCFWDEPDNYLAISEVGHFVLSLRQAFHSGSQFIATSHNAETIRSFSGDNTFLLARKSHVEPTIVRRVDELQVSGDLVDALIRDDVESVV